MHNKDGKFILFVANLILLIIVISSVGEIGQNGMRLFTYRWTTRIGNSDPRTNATSMKIEIYNIYNLTRDSSAPNLGRMLDRVFELGRCKPSMYGGDIAWSQEGASPTCNCLRNAHVMYAKAVNPMGVRLSASDYDLPQNKNNIWNITQGIFDKCLMSVRNTQVEEFVETEGLTSNTAATMMYWNVVGSFVSLALLFLDVFIPVDNQTGTLMGMSETIWGMGQWVLAFIWFGFAVTAAVMAGAWSSPVYLVWYLLFTAFLFFFGYTVYSAASAGESVGVDKETMKSPLLDRQQSDASNVQRDVFVWTAFALVAPHVANTMFMLLQRRDWILNGAVFMSVFAACICPIAIEYMQDFFSGIVIAGSDDFQKAFIQHKRKNRMMKIMLIVILSVVLLLTCSTLPVFPASSFSNMFYTVLIVSACLSLCFVSLFRHIVHFNMQGDVPAIPSKWDLYPLDPVTLETVARFIFTLAALCDVWGVRTLDAFGTNEDTLKIIRT